MDNLFGIHGQALKLKSARAEVLANNLVNSSTPGFKARDFDFQAELKNEVERQTQLQKTHQMHTQAGDNHKQVKLSYRTPVQTSTDGNTVENDVEQMLYAQNALEYKATIGFIKHRTSKVIQALRGGE